MNLNTLLECRPEQPHCSRMADIITYNHFNVGESAYSRDSAAYPQKSSISKATHRQKFGNLQSDTQTYAATCYYLKVNYLNISWQIHLTLNMRLPYPYPIMYILSSSSQIIRASMDNLATGMDSGGNI